MNKLEQIANKVTPGVHFILTLADIDIAKKELSVGSFVPGARSMKNAETLGLIVCSSDGWRLTKLGATVKKLLVIDESIDA